jgi:DNA-binding transcriptional LysR family regulator
MNANAYRFRAATRAPARSTTRPSARADDHAAPALPDLRRLYAFVVVAEELHFRRAAERLLITQSPLSRIIKGLEHDLGVALFDRNRRRVKLTPAGEALLNGVRDVLVRAEGAVARARRAAPPQEATSESMA